MEGLEGLEALSLVAAQEAVLDVAELEAAVVMAVRTLSIKKEESKTRKTSTMLPGAMEARAATTATSAKAPKEIKTKLEAMAEMEDMGEQKKRCRHIRGMKENWERLDIRQFI